MIINQSIDLTFVSFSHSLHFFCFSFDTTEKYFFSFVEMFIRSSPSVVVVRSFFFFYFRFRCIDRFQLVKHLASSCRCCIRSVYKLTYVEYSSLTDKKKKRIHIFYFLFFRCADLVIIVFVVVSISFHVIND